MNKKILSLTAAVAVLGFAAIAANAAEPKVTLCHATSSLTNEYVIVEVGSAAEATHLNHGDVYPNADGTCGGGIGEN